MYICRLPEEEEEDVRERERGERGGLCSFLFCFGLVRTGRVSFGGNCT